MRTLGLIGGCSAEATTLYYAGLNRGVRAQRPGHGAKLLLWSFDVEAIDAHCRAEDWAAALEAFVTAARWLERGGAEGLMICTNTMHRIAEPLAAAVAIPLLHIGDIAAARAHRLGVRRPLLLGTRYLMQETFYRARLERAGLEVRLPAPCDQKLIHQIIYDELMDGRVTDGSRAALAAIVEDAVAQQGADGVILACTELGLALRDGEVSAPVLDTAALHIEAGVAFALAEPARQAPQGGASALA
jgi:aspartate racemase